MNTIISWNVNGIRAIVKKDFYTQLQSLNADVVCLQETKAQDEQVKEALSGITDYHVYCNSATRKGYSGVAILTKTKPISVTPDMGIAEHDDEGRVLCAEYDSFYIVTVYTPNSGNGLKRLAYRKQWDEDFKQYVNGLEEKKPVVVCGDLNVAHQRIDIARPDANYNKSAGFTQDEIDGLSHLLSSGMTDTFRALYPDEVAYSWWSYRGGARAKNIGWRLDYVLISEPLMSRVKNSYILQEYTGSDHCPVGIDLN